MSIEIYSGDGFLINGVIYELAFDNYSDEEYGYYFLNRNTNEAATNKYDSHEDAIWELFTEVDLPSHVLKKVNVSYKVNYKNE
jgi:hypothetical protein